MFYHLKYPLKCAICVVNSPCITLLYYYLSTKYTNIQNATIKFMCKHSTQTGDCLNNPQSMWKNINIFWNT